MSAILDPSIQIWSRCTNFVSKLSWNNTSKLHIIMLFDNLGNLDYPETYKG
jgi:hypothetical protein